MGCEIFAGNEELVAHPGGAAEKNKKNARWIAQWFQG